jgi:hypothetical protein
MIRRLPLLLLPVLLLLALEVQAQPRLDRLLQDSLGQSVLDRELARFAPAKLGLPPGSLSPRELRLAGKLVEAARHMDRIFRQQVFEDGAYWYDTLSLSPHPKAKRLAALLELHYGPWNRLNDDQPFMGVGLRPKGVAFYPPDASVAEIDAFIRNNPQQAGAIMSPYSVVRRSGRDLVAVGYSEKYKRDLRAASAALREAAGLTDDKPLKEFLLARADAFLSDNYYPSELLWMDSVKSPWVVVLGPYEYYEDRLLGAKAAFEAILAITDRAETERFRTLLSKLPELFKTLPIPAQFKARLKVQPQSEVLIANLLYAAGQTRAGAQTTAFSLPNDPRVIKEKGSRQVILKNVAQAKFEKSWLPLSKLVVAEEQLSAVDFDSYFNLLLATQLAHTIVVDGGDEEVAGRLRQRRQIIGEARADAMGLLVLLQLAEYGLLPELTERTAAITWLVSVFRVVRLDSGGPHSMAKTAAYNFLAARGAFTYDPTARRFSADVNRLGPAVEELVAELTDLWLAGDYKRAGSFIIDHGLPSEEMRATIGLLDEVPVDIRPSYGIEELLPASQN